MAKHDIVTYNSTTKGFETDLGDNNAEIKGTGNKTLSFKIVDKQQHSRVTGKKSVKKRGKKRQSKKKKQTKKK